MDDDGKIRSLFGGPLPTFDSSANVNREPVPGVVAALEGLLEDARAGIVVGFAGAILRDDHSAGYIIMGNVGGFSMQGALQCAATTVTMVNMSTAEEDDED